MAKVGDFDERLNTAVADKQARALIRTLLNRAVALAGEPADLL
jgi:hypothetical protein